MKFWCDDYDTYASENFQDLKQELIVLGNDFNVDDWQEVSENTTMYCCDPNGIDFNKFKNDESYKQQIKEKYSKTLKYAFENNKCFSETGKAWFMCSTEW